MLKGKIEVYKNYGKPNQELVQEGENLVVDGASELLADLMTVSPSLAEVTSTSALLDTSNYIVQALSFGKPREAYLQNAHYWKKAEDRDVTGIDSAVTQTEIDGIIRVAVSSATTSSYTPPNFKGVAPKPEDIKLVDKALTAIERELGIQGLEFGQNLNFAQYGTSNNGYTLSGVLNVGSGASGNYNWLSYPNRLDFDVDYAEPGIWGVNIKNDLTEVVNVPSSVLAPPSSLPGTVQVARMNSKESDSLIDFSRTTSWIRQIVEFPEDISEKKFTFSIYCRRVDGDGSNDLSSIRLRVQEAGTDIELAGYADTELTTTGTWYRATISFSTGKEVLDNKLIVYISIPDDKDDNDLAPQLLQKHIYLSHAQLEYGASASAWSNEAETSVSNFPALFLGCYGPKFNVSPSNISCYYVSSFDADFLDNPSANLVVSADTSSSYNYYGKVDRYGFIASADGGYTCKGFSSSSEANVSDTGVITYYTSIGSGTFVGDLILGNAFGGIYNIGLWSIDLEKTQAGGYTAPFTFNKTNNPIKYKLFAKKNFTKDLTYIEDDGTDAGVRNYSALTILWRIKTL